MSDYLPKNVLLNYMPIIIGLILSLGTAYYAATTPHGERNIGWKIYDYYNRYYPSPQPSSNIVIVDVDDQSLEAIGQWPWPRYRLAETIRIIIEGRPSSLLLDILLAERDRTSIVNIQKQLEMDFGIDIEVQGLPAVLEDNDKYLSSILTNSQVVLGSVATQNRVDDIGLCASGNKSTIQSNHIESLEFPRMQGVICPLDGFYQQSASTGFINSSIDSDGLLRRVPILMSHKNKLIPSLSLAGLETVFGNRFTVKPSLSGSTVEINGREIPLDRKGRALLNFRGKGRSYQTVPILNVLNGTTPPDFFLGKIVLLGATASGLNDVVSTSLDIAFPGTEAHAVFIDNVLNNDVIYTPAWFENAETITIIIIGMLTAMIVMSFTPRTCYLVSLLILVFLLVIPAALLYNYQLYVSPFLCVANFLAILTLATIAKYYAAEKHLTAVLASISKANFSVIDSMATVAELRDPETGGHIIRTRLYVKVLAKKLQTMEEFKDEVDDDFIEYINAAAPLHDIGKVGIADKILLKPGKLSNDEFDVMRTHAQLGGDLLKQAEANVGFSPYLRIASEIAASHHEKWDGSGYPMGLKGNEIPLSARIMAIADVFDALVNKRVYKEAISFERTIDIMMSDSGTHFDPTLMEAFMEVKDEFIEIALKISDD
ncbi:CHASE2 domain-containing protein [Vibrio hannami]|uniref:CHASE2 domain-containing protein n=1 Tax=Vibrio hannami TaxID=2717094 RepID=UPI00240F64CF|nr:CHASE2 domain-containing protein [Vibrio hannami]MDG3085817.1 CHASE2 domain-containing protein [Vibrio hannami]